MWQYLSAAIFFNDNSILHWSGPLWLHSNVMQSVAEISCTLLCAVIVEIWWYHYFVCCVLLVEWGHQTNVMVLVLTTGELWSMIWSRLNGFFTKFSLCVIEYCVHGFASGYIVSQKNFPLWYCACIRQIQTTFQSSLDTVGYLIITLLQIVYGMCHYKSFENQSVFGKHIDDDKTDKSGKFFCYTCCWLQCCALWCHMSAISMIVLNVNQ